MVHMKGGDDETSYASNSRLQKIATSKTFPIVEETLKEMFYDKCNNRGCFRMVDLGCSSGPNTLYVVSLLYNTLKNYNFKEIQVFLNDLPDNDFNNLFKMVQIFCDEQKDRFIYGLPGSFYKRLFPSRFLHFAYSSYSVHWLSQVPKGLDQNNMESIYISQASSRIVCKAYAKQFYKDFFEFLRLRGEEMVENGRMVLTFVGRSVEDASSKDEQPYYTYLGEALYDMMIHQDIINIEDLYSFNIPFYAPRLHEVEKIIMDEGSFVLGHKDSFKVWWDATDDEDESSFDKLRCVKCIGKCVRAILEPMLDSHFHRTINCDDLFKLYEEKAAKYLKREHTFFFTIVISLKKK